MAPDHWSRASLLLVVILLATVFFFYLININITLPHRHYRKKLGDAYLIQPVVNPQSADSPAPDAGPPAAPAVCIERVASSCRKPPQRGAPPIT
jgi:hypothetical protein